MECCVGVFIETVLQVVKFYTVVNDFKKLTFRTVVIRRSQKVESTFLAQTSTVQRDILSSIQTDASQLLSIV